MLRCLSKVVVGWSPSVPIARSRMWPPEMGISRACASNWVNRFRRLVSWADARVSVLRAITEAKTLLDGMRRDITAAVDPLTAETTS